MKILLTSIGSRGDVQPIVALALELRGLGHDPVLCVAPNFQAWIESFGLPCVPIGPDLEHWTRSRAVAQTPPQPPSPEAIRAMTRHSVVEQFRVLGQAAQGCGLIIACNMLQTAARSVAESLGSAYLYAAYCPTTLPSPEHPPTLKGAPYAPARPALTNRLLWLAHDRRINQLFRDAANEQRAELGLKPVRNIARHIATARPWLATDPVLGPAAAPIAMAITQTGAWFLDEPTPLPDDVEAFLADGPPPIYVGFGSMQASEDLSRVVITAARAVGRRAIIARGWGRLALIDDGADCLVVDSVNHARLFPRVAAVVHHGGAGTTAAAARAGAPQVIAPYLYDQYYWAQRVQALGIGAAGPGASSAARHLSADTLADALRRCLTPAVSAQAQAIAARMERHGARLAAERISATFG